MNHPTVSTNTIQAAQTLDTIQAAQTLDALAGARGTLYVQDGTIKESRHSLGRAFLGLFSSRIRAENRAAVERVSSAMRQAYGFNMSSRESLSGSTLSSMTREVKIQNRKFMNRFIARLTREFGDEATPVVEELRLSEVYTSGRRVKETMREVHDRLKTMREAREAHERLTLERAGANFRDNDVGADEIFSAMKAMPRYREMLEATFGIPDMTVDGEPKPLLTIEAHTRQVMDLYEQQKGHYDLPGLQDSLRGRPGFENFNADRFMKMVLLFHDIGKGLAFQTGREQHEVTAPILRDTMEKMGFSEQEIRLANNLVDNDLLGEWQAGRRHEVADTRSRLRVLAQDSGIPLKDYLTMQKLFYISDAGSYPPLRQAFMREDDNHKLHFAENRTDTLIQSFDQQFGAMHAEVAGRLLAPNALAEGRVHPLELFAPDMTQGNGCNVYDVSRAILENEADLRAHIEANYEQGPLRTTAQARLNEAVEMARMAVTMDADRWTPEHTQGVIQARLEIRNAGITQALPRGLSAGSGEDMADGKLAELSVLRGAGSPTARFYALVDDKGGDSRMLQCVSQQQVTSSWCGTSLAVKGYLEQSRAVSEDRYYRPAANVELVGSISRDSAAACYDRFAHAPAEYWQNQHAQLFRNGTVGVHEVVGAVDASNAGAVARAANAQAQAAKFDTSIRYQIAMQMEMLSNMEFPGNDPKNGTVTIYRTEFPAVAQMYGLGDGRRPPPPPGEDNRVGTTLHMRRSTYDSGSLYSPVTAGGSAHTTTQEVPYHRIFGSFLLGATPDSTQSNLYTDVMHEVMFMTEGLPSVYCGNFIALRRDFINDYDARLAAAPPGAAPQAPSAS